MDIETLLTGSKWEIIQSLSKESLSPLELAKRLNTTIANISQQLRLLQAANLIKKQKTGHAAKGKPRTLFSLAEDYALIIVFTKGFTEKKLVKLSEKNKQSLKIIS